MGQYGMTEYYKNKLQEGLEYQDFISDELRREGINIGVYASRKYQIERGESAAGIEIKLDKNFRKTGNLYIEVAEKSNANIKDYTASGIMRCDNSWGYLIGDYCEAFLLSVNQIRAICCWPAEKQSGYSIRQVEIPTSKGLLIPVVFIVARNFCIKHFIFNKQT